MKTRKRPICVASQGSPLNPCAVDHGVDAAAKEVHCLHHQFPPEIQLGQNRIRGIFHCGQRPDLPFVQRLDAAYLALNTARIGSASVDRAVRPYHSRSFVRSRAMLWLCNWQTRLSVTPRTAAISFKFMSCS